MSTYTTLLYHVVFSTDGRRPFLEGPWVERLYAYLGGIVRCMGGTMIVIGGVADHVHLLLRIPTRIALADLIRVVKSRSSNWTKDNGGPKDFAWQVGYSAFTVSSSCADHVARYIRRQPLHHRERSSLDELVQLLELHDVEYDPKYLR